MVVGREIGRVWARIRAAPFRSVASAHAATIQRPSSIFDRRACAVQLSLAFLPAFFPIQLREYPYSDAVLIPHFRVLFDEHLTRDVERQVL